MPQAIVIGYGNPSRCDDSVGHYIVDKIAEAAGDSIDCLACYQLDIELADTIKDYELIIFTDAHVNFPEELRVVDVEPIFSSSAFTHLFTPGSLLSLANTLYQKTPRAFLVSVRGHDFSFGTELSEKTQKSADMAVTRILEIVNS